MKGPSTSYTNIDEYIAGFDDQIQQKLTELRKFIKQRLPEGIEETISYGIPTFKLNGKYVIYFAGYAKHISIYPIPPGPAEFEQKIAPYVKGRGTLQFPNSEPLPYALIEEVIKYSVKRHQEAFNS